MFVTFVLRVNVTTASQLPVTKRILSRQGVPDAAVEEFGDDVSSTHEEALALGSWIRKTGAKKIIIVSDPFHTRRVRWLFNKELQPAGTEILTAAAPSLKYDASNWWQAEQGPNRISERTHQIRILQVQLLKTAWWRIQRQSRATVTLQRAKFSAGGNMRPACAS